MTWLHITTWALWVKSVQLLHPRLFHVCICIAASRLPDRRALHLHLCICTLHLSSLHVFTASVPLHLCISHLSVLHCTLHLCISPLCLALHLSSLHLHRCTPSSCQPDCLAPCLTWAVHDTAFSACLVWFRLGWCCILGMFMTSCTAM